ncbi:MAG: hypothetical protein EOO51_00255 [Flavobacterium sp.]|nr:MAG: hypothetical protein EOO51_00255 [Flavobacterium sp.]
MNKYSSPEAAIITLEEGYTNKDLEGILASKDFKAEAKLILEQSSYNYDLDDEAVISETAKLLELSLIKSLQENGYPNFEKVKREFSEVTKYKDNIFIIEERLTFPDNTQYENRIFLSQEKDKWKVAMIEE